VSVETLKVQYQQALEALAEVTMTKLEGHEIIGGAMVIKRENWDKIYTATLTVEYLRAKLDKEKEKEESL